MIITFGSINVDFVYEVEEMPQPGQTLLAKGFRTEAGGKGANQALAAARDGADSEGEPGEFLDLLLGNLDQPVDQRPGKFGR